MADYNLSRSRHTALVANIVDTVTVAGDSIEVKNRDAALSIFFRVDGVNPVVSGDDTFILLPGESLIVTLPSPGHTADTVKLISSGAAAYSITTV